MRESEREREREKKKRNRRTNKAVTVNACRRDVWAQKGNENTPAASTRCVLCCFSCTTLGMAPALMGTWLCPPRAQQPAAVLAGGGCGSRLLDCCSAASSPTHKAGRGTWCPWETRSQGRGFGFLLEGTESTLATLGTSSTWFESAAVSRWYTVWSNRTLEWTTGVSCWCYLPDGNLFSTPGRWLPSRTNTGLGGTVRDVGGGGALLRVWRRLMFKERGQLRGVFQVLFS